MDKKVVGLVGAISGLASLDTAQASTATAPNATEILGARSYTELLDPIPNALALLREADAAAARAELESSGSPNEKVAQYYYHHHHHHHHHRWYHHHHHHHHRWYHHHHHHHHHHRWYRGYYGDPGYYGPGPGIGIIIR